VGTTPITSGTTTRVLYDNAGVLGEYSSVPVALGGTNCTSASITCFNNITNFSASGTTGVTSSNLVFSSSPAFTGTVTASNLTATGTITASTFTRIGPAANVLIGTVNTNYNMVTLNGLLNETTGIGISGRDTASDPNMRFYVPTAGSFLFEVAGVQSKFSIDASGDTVAAGTSTVTGVIATAAAPTVAAAQIGYGSTTAAAANCNVAVPTPTGCVVINVAGTTRYIPYY